MSKHEIQLFFTSLVLTLLFFAFAGAFLLVNANTSRRERGGNDQIFSLSETAADTYQMTLFGREAQVSLSPLRRVGNTYTDYAPVAVPRSLYALGTVYDYGVFWGNEFYEKYKENIYLQEVESVAAETPPDSEEKQS